MSSTPQHSTAPTEWRTTLELALLVSTVAVALAIALSWFAGVSEAPIVIATLVVGSLIGWSQPSPRVVPADAEPLEASGPRSA